MVHVHVDYQGQVRCLAVHGPSGNTLMTDAPVDNHGKGEAFSPTDLIATALATCVLTVMGIRAEKEGWDLTGMSADVEKTMSTDLPRRIVKLGLRIQMPAGLSEERKNILEHLVHTCPVHKSIRSDIQIPTEFVYPD